MERKNSVSQERILYRERKGHLKDESTKYSLLVQLKKETPPGPFTNVEEIQEYASNQQSDKTTKTNECSKK